MKRAFLTRDSISAMLSRHYGLRMLCYKELSGYDDKNIWVDVESDGTNKNIEQTCCHGYLLKVANSLDSKNTKIIDAQHDIMLRVNQNGIPSPRPVPTLTGQLHLTLDLPAHDPNIIGSTAQYHAHLVHLYRYLPGSTLNSVALTEGLCYKAGVMAGRVDLALKGLKPQALLEHHWRWHLDFIPELLDVLHEIKNHTDRKLANDIFEAFQTYVLSHMDELPMGTIHTDFNEGNILVKKRSHPDVWTDEYDLAAILDYGDSSYFPYIFEVAIAMTHLSIMSDNKHPLPVKTASGYVLAGYVSQTPLSDFEIHLLKLCMCARTAQTLVIGEDPSNTFTLNSVSILWSQLKNLWNMDTEKLVEEWKDIQHTCERKLNFVPII